MRASQVDLKTQPGDPMRMLGQGHESEINVTPFIDVLLTLIVMFIVLIQIRFVHDVQIPPPQRARAAQGRAIVLELKPGGGYAINGETVSPHRLATRIGEIFRQRPDKLLYVRVGEGWNYAGVMAAVDVAKGAGVEEIGYVPPNGH
jgi:biopolymer transport protein ExbD